MNQSEISNTNQISHKDDWEILRDVCKMLEESNVLNTPSSTPILNFKHPHELMVTFSALTNLQILQMFIQMCYSLCLETLRFKNLFTRRNELYRST